MNPIRLASMASCWRAGATVVAFAVCLMSLAAYAQSQAPAPTAAKPSSAGASTSEMTPAAKLTLAREKFATAQRLRIEAPRIRAKIAALENDLNGLTAPLPVLTAKRKELSALKEDQSYFANQISILEESIESLGCDPATGNPKAPVTKPINSDPRAPTFNFVGTWIVTDSDRAKIGTLTISYSESPGIIDCNGADGNEARGGAGRFIGGRMEFENSQHAWEAIRFGGHVKWNALVTMGPPRPAVFLGCVTGNTAEVWLHPETGNVPDGRLKLRGNTDDKKMATGSLNFSRVGHQGAYRWRLTKQ